MDSSAPAETEYVCKLFKELKQAQYRDNVMRLSTGFTFPVENGKPYAEYLFRSDVFDDITTIFDNVRSKASFHRRGMIVIGCPGTGKVRSVCVLIFIICTTN